MNAQSLKFTGESLWKSTGVGVKDHSMEIQFIIISGEGSITPSNFPFTSCMNNYYFNEVLPDDGYVQNSTTGILIVKASNDLNGESKSQDYRDGLSTVDVVRVYRHINGVETFENYPLHYDAPYNYVSADIDKDYTITANDAEKIRQVLLGNYTPGSEDRNSWEWFREKSIISANDFDTNPYYYCLSEGNGDMNSNPMIYTYVTVGEINNDPFFYYGLRTTKVGDINNNNSQSCIAPYTLVEVNENSEHTIENNLYHKGDKISLKVNIKSEELIEAFQLPLLIDNEKFQIIEINENLLSLDFHSNRLNSKEFLFLGYNTYNENLKNLKTYSFDIVLELLEDSYLSDSYFTNLKTSDNIEIISDGKYVKGSISTAIQKLPFINIDYYSNKLKITGIDQRAEVLSLNYITLDGRLISSETIPVNNQKNILHRLPDFDDSIQMYVVSISNKYQNDNVKVVR